MNNLAALLKAQGKETEAAAVRRLKRPALGRLLASAPNRVRFAFQMQGDAVRVVFRVLGETTRQ